MIKNSYKILPIIAAIVLLHFLSVSAFARDVTLEWDDNTETDLAGYKLYYKSGSGGTPYNGTDANGGASPSPIDVGTG